MKYTWRLRPENYALGETEQFYTDMAAKGLRLVKHGAYLSKFEKTEPADYIYRIELATPAFMDEAWLPEEQVAVYEESGWRLVDRYGLVYVFEGKPGTGALELYSDHRERLPVMKKLRSSQIRGLLVLAALLAFWFFAATSMTGGRNGDRWGALLHAWYQGTAIELCLLCCLLKGFLDLFWELGRVLAMTARTKAGKPLDRRTHLHNKVLRFISRSLYAGVLICLLLFFGQLLGRDKYDMPLTADGPYLQLSDLGFEGDRTTVYQSSKTSYVDRSSSLAAQIWDTYEALELADGKKVWMYNEVYRVKWGSPEDALRGVMAEAAFGNFQQVQIPGLDEAWRSGLECAARAGDTVWYITAMGDGPQEGYAWTESILRVLADKHGNK